MSVCVCCVCYILFFASVCFCSCLFVCKCVGVYRHTFEECPVGSSGAFRFFVTVTLGVPAVTFAMRLPLFVLHLRAHGRH
jgi:hypothetical protein